MELVHPPAMYYALVHNRVPVVNRLRIENLDDETAVDVEVVLALAGPDGPLTEPWTRSAVTIAAGGSVGWDDFADFAPDAALLKGADESFPVSYRVSVRIADGHEFELSAQSRVLAHNEWLSAPALYESIAAFVQPNTASVNGVLRAAGELLQRETGSSSLQGYQAGPKRAAQIGAAVYEALRERAITYVGLPASFEDTGQKVRTTAAVLGDRIGNCIDLSVTYAACLEAAGLHPLIWMVRGHAFAGFFLNEERLAETVSSDPAQMINVVESSKAIAVELTAIGPGADSVGFAEAAKLGRAHLRGPGELLGMVDIHLAHRSGIRPMPSADVGAEDSAEPTPPDTPERRLALPDELVTSGVLDDAEMVADQRPADGAPARVTAWRRALLDLSLRNPLLKLPKRGKGLDLHVPAGGLAALDDLVHGGKPLNIVAQDALGGVQELQGVRRAQDLPDEVVFAELATDHRIYASVTQDHYVERMRGLQRAARTVEQETGGNYLYLTLGSLVHPTPTGEAHAPLFLLPARIEGGAGRRPYAVIADGDELAAPNQCLVEWLRQKHGIEIPALRTPVLDGSGIDIGASLRAIRQALVEGELHYRVDETASLRLLEFSTFQMWRDLTHHWKTFLGNPVVQHLAESPGQPMDAPEPVDARVDETEMVVPIAADGSQLRAVALAERGHSFVLEGPPGTGKSQTITNLIAHAMASGKTVLFVAEKQAALDVVKRRLTAIGLDAFCLDVHGRKQSQRSISRQLRAARERRVDGDRHEWESLTAKYRSRVSALQHYPDQVHDTNRSGFSVWSAYRATLVHGDGPAACVPASYFSLSPEQRVAAENAARALPSAGRSARLRPHHPWSISGLRSIADLDPHAAAAAARELEEVRQWFGRLPEPLRQRMAALPHPMQLGQVLGAAGLAAQGALPDAARTAAAAQAGWDDEVRGAGQLVAAFQQQHREVLATFRPEFFVHPAFDDLAVQAEAAARGLIGKKKRRLELARSLQAHLAPGAAIDATAVLEVFRAAASARHAASDVARAVHGVRGLGLPPSWLPTRPDAVRAIQAAHRSSQVSRDARHRMPALWDVFNGMGAQVPARGLERFLGAWQTWLGLLGTTEEEFARWTAGSDWAAAWERDGRTWVDDLDGYGLLPVQRWGAVLGHTDVLAQAGLTDFRECVLGGEVAPDEAEVAVLRGIARTAVDERLRSGGLDYFDADAHEQQVVDFLGLGDEVRAQLPERIAASIVQNRGSGDFDKRAGELLRRLEGRRTDRLSFREAVVRYPDVITGLTPCLLMSPASVAAFLEPGALGFDIVVFDEASQIRVPQAIGAMGRGRSVVVVGDSKQMPPTSIMQASNDDEPDDPTVPEDLDSILAECVESGLPRELLTWHYRSTDESLIAFSNGHYYDGELASLPAPGGDPAAGIAWRRVEGRFESGGSRTNPVEASRIVAEISRILSDPRTADRSIGVVTFNVQQRDLVLNLLEESEDERIQAALARDDDEELFVKNLENVQGDERDVVLFSLAFSPDPRTGRVRLRLGPLINTGGERRLNVAVTRARTQVIVVSSFDPEDLDLSATNSVGVHHLRAYLEVAARGVGSSGDIVSRGGRPDVDRITAEVAGAIRARGHEVETRYGLSHFTVDIAVRTPGSRSWSVAVLLDGPEWARRATVADRDAAPRLLTDLMHWPAAVRVWLPQWMADREGVLDRIDRAVASASVVGDTAPAAEPTPEVPGAALPVEAGPKAVAEVVEPPPAAEVEADDAPEPLLRSALRTEAAPADHRLVEEFVPFQPVTMGTREQLDELAHAARVQRLVQECMGEVIAAEGPIEVERLMRLVNNCFGLRQVHAERKNRMQRFLPKQYRVTRGLGTRFVWPAHRDPETWRGFRRTPDPGGRPFAAIPPEEIVNAMRHAFDSGRAGDTEQLRRATRESLGYGKTTASMQRLMDQALAWGVTAGRVPKPPE
ncbi:DUF4011 domain-containing protein [Saccharopolyspora cebuensis]|uniref:DUF4011 domain-containing protein n=1 Tax=Saccharopolyspora cebuensis TaxID=418759 RepID=A0ABV4CHR6_9PSEU